MLVESVSGIRGIFGESLTEDVARKYAAAFQHWLSSHSKKDNPKIVVGMDPRPSSPQIKEAILSVLRNAVDLHIVSTPMCEHTVRDIKADGGIMITGSHNPKEYNGMKFLDEQGGVIISEYADKVIALYRNNEVEAVPSEHVAEKIPEEELISSYQKFLENIIGEKGLQQIREANLSVVLDPNGGAGVPYTQILESFGVTVHALNTTVGEFVRVIEPSPESLAYLKEIVVKHSAAIAAGFDCDADRVELVTEHKMISGQLMLALVTDAMLGSIPNPEKEVVVVNDATSRIVHEIAQGYGAKVEEVKVGEANVVAGMDAHNSLVGGEGSSGGGIVSPSRCRDGMLSLLCVLRLVAERKTSVEEIMQAYPGYITLRKNIKLPKPFSEMQPALEEFYKTKGNLVTRNDSVKTFIDEETYVWFRPSKTENSLLRVFVDAKDEEKAKILFDEAIALTQSQL